MNVSGGGGGASGGMSASDLSKINKIYEQFSQLDGIQDQLPSITSRLVDLNSLHSDASTFCSRLSAAETVIKESTMILDSCEKTLSLVEEGMAQTLGQVENNVKELDNKLLSITKKK